MALPELKSSNSGSAIFKLTAQHVELNLVKGFCNTIFSLLFQQRRPF